MIQHSKPFISEEDKIAVQEALNSGQISEGHVVTKFENSMSSFLNLFGGVATSSGTTALVVALKALNVENGDVLIPSYVCRNVYDAVRLAGGRPNLYDIDKDWCPTSETIYPKLTSNTKAIVLVHTFGIACNTDFISSLPCPVIEDCCQSIGLMQNGRVVGSAGRYAVVSFHATKLMTTGEGGMAFSSDRNEFARLYEVKHGDSSELCVRAQFPLSDLQAALGLSQLKRYDTFLSRRSNIAEYYYNVLKEWPENLPLAIRDKSIFFRFPIRIKNLDYDNVKNWYLEKGIHVRRGVDELLHRRLGFADEGYHNTAIYFNETLSLPIYPALTDSEIEYIAQNTKEVLRKYAN